MLSRGCLFHVCLKSYVQSRTAYRKCERLLSSDIVMHLSLVLNIPFDDNLYGQGVINNCNFLLVVYTEIKLCIQFDYLLAIRYYELTVRVCFDFSNHDLNLPESLMRMCDITV